MNSHDDPVLAAAAAALLIMRAVLASDAEVQPNRVVLLPGTALLDDARAAEALAALRPVKCTPSTRGRALLVWHAPLSADDALIVERTARTLGGGYLSRAGWQALRENGRSRVLLAGRGEQLLLDAAALEKSYYEYVIPEDELAIGGRLPMGEECDLGAEWVVVVGRARPINSAALSPSDEARWAELVSLEQKVHTLLNSGRRPISTDDLIQLIPDESDDA